MFDRWIIERESFKLPYDTRIRIRSGTYGWDELLEFYLLGDDVYQIGSSMALTQAHRALMGTHHAGLSISMS